MIEINAALLEITATRNKWQEILKEVSIFIVEHQIQEENNHFKNLQNNLFLSAYISLPLGISTTFLMFLNESKSIFVSRKLLQSHKH